MRIYDFCLIAESREIYKSNFKLTKQAYMYNFPFGLKYYQSSRHMFFFLGIGSTGSNMVLTSFKTTLDVCRQLVTTFVYIIYRILHVILDLCNRVLSNSIIQGSSEDSAMIGHVLWRCKVNLVGTTTPGDFLCLFTSTVDLDYVLKPTVSLYAVSASEVFVETPEHVNIYSSDENVFVMLAQFEWCIRVIKVPIKAFHCLADKVGDPTVPVTWMTNTDGADPQFFAKF